MNHRHLSAAGPHDPDSELARLRAESAIAARRSEQRIRDRLIDQSDLAGMVLGAIGQRVRLSVGPAGELRQIVRAVDTEVIELSTDGAVTWVNAACISWVELESEVPGAGSAKSGSWLGLLGDLCGSLNTVVFTDGTRFFGELVGVGGAVQLLDDRGVRRYCDAWNIAWLSRRT